MELKFKTRWDYSGWKQRSFFPSCWTQGDWNATFVTMCNQMDTAFDGSKTIEVSPNLIHLLNTLDYFDERNNILSNKYKIVFDPTKNDNEVRMTNGVDSIMFYVDNYDDYDSNVMNKEVKAPNDYSMFCDMKKVFLAGSIEQGKAIEWQDMIVSKATKNNILFLNPRRDSWDATLEQNIDNPVFNEQVSWELDGLEQADLIIMYFDPNTVSPITLVEFGLHCKSGKLVVYCPDGYFRKGNIDITSEKYNVRLVSTLAELVDAVDSL